MIKGIGQIGFKGRVDLIEGPIGGEKLQAGANRLHPEVVLLVDHYADGLLPIHHRAATNTLGGMLATDEMPFDEDLLLNSGKLCHFLRERIFHLGNGFEREANLLHNGETVLLASPAGKGMASEIASQTHAAGNHNITLRTGGPHPFSWVFQEGGKSHRHNHSFLF